MRGRQSRPGGPTAATRPVNWEVVGDPDDRLRRRPANPMELHRHPPRDRRAGDPVQRHRDFLSQPRGHPDSLLAGIDKATDLARAWRRVGVPLQHELRHQLHERIGCPVCGELHGGRQRQRNGRYRLAGPERERPEHHGVDSGRACIRERAPGRTPVATPSVVASRPASASAAGCFRLDAPPGSRSVAPRSAAAVAGDQRQLTSAPRALTALKIPRTSARPATSTSSTPR